LDLSEKTRLEKLLGMLGSSFDGERATAAAMIQRMAESKKITINELIALAHSPPTSPGSGSASQGRAGQQKPPPPPPPEPDFTDIDKADDLLKMYDADYELSEKQLVIVEKILRKASRVFT
jgi:hypothetical protein